MWLSAGAGSSCSQAGALSPLCHQFCLAGGEAHSLDDKLLFSPQIASWWDVMASRTLANVPGTSLLPEEGGEGAGLLAWLKKLRFVCSPCCNASLLWCLSASSALCEAFLDTLLHGELAKEGSGKKKEKQLPSHWRGGGEGDKKTLPTNSEINTAQFNN